MFSNTVIFKNHIRNFHFKLPMFKHELSVLESIMNLTCTLAGEKVLGPKFLYEGVYT